MLSRGQVILTKVKKILREILNWGLVVFLLPQLFLFFYYFLFLFKRQGNWLPFVGTLSKFGLSISWVSLPFLTILYAGIRRCITRRVHGLLVWGISFVLGASWIVLWDWTIFPVFGFWQSIIPLMFCSSLACLYAVAGHLYREGAVIEKPFDYHEKTVSPEEGVTGMFPLADGEGDHGQGQ